MMEYCLSQVDQPISIQDLAARIGLDRFYLSRLFKKEVGIPLKEYIWKTKEDEAMRLLDQTDLPIQVIARSVGFEDPLHFSRTFTKKAGCSPSQYRKKVRREKEQPEAA